MRIFGKQQMFLQVDCIVGRIKGDTKGDTKRVTEGETKLKKSSKRGIFCDVTREDLSSHYSDLQ